MARFAWNLRKYWKCPEVTATSKPKLDDSNSSSQHTSTSLTLPMSWALDFFYNRPYPPLRTTLAWCEHVTLSHLMLKRKGLSLAPTSSKYLKALNKIIKRILRALQGGGGSRAGQDHN
jgi:hypothetical protein